MKTFSAIGLMSGTSADGISAAWTEVGRTVHVTSALTLPFSPGEQRRILMLRDAGAREVAEAGMWLGERFAAAANRLIRRVGRRPDVIGSHGQTVYHLPGRASLQVGEPAVIAQRTGVTTVADFRPADIAAGGQGAPLILYFDEFVFGGRHVRALQNIGGIANVTVVGRRVKTLAFDTGPGNTLIDEAVRRMTRGKLQMDRGGRIAAQGRVDAALLRRLMSHPYFRRRPPKSTGREMFSAECFGGRRVTRDVIATLTYHTALTIAESYRRFLPRIEEVIVSGGGVYNSTLMTHLQALLFPAPVKSIRLYGIDPLSKEPAAFALMAVQCVRGIAVRGKIVPGGNYKTLLRKALT